MNEKLKNFAYAAVILAALAVGYRQLVPATPTAPTPDTMVKQIEAAAAAKVQLAESRAKLEADAVEAEAKRKRKIVELLSEQERLNKALATYSDMMEKETNRLFKRIPKDSIPALWNRIEKIQARIQAIDKELGKLHYDPMEPGVQARF